jgi:septal ring factor EnvC (AmiA/AmiB activator)
LIRSAVLCALLLLAVWSPAQEAAPPQANQLENVREQIRQVQTGISAARDEAEALQEELQQAESSAAALRAQIDAAEHDTAAREQRLADLKRQAQEQQELLVRESGQLARQVRVAYMAGREDYLKLLLNQEDPALVGRMLAYYDYFNRARIGKIRSIGSAMDGLARMQVEIQDETARLDGLRQQQLVKLGEMDRYRASRREIIARIHAHISDQDRDLQRLRKNERELTGLLSRIHEHRPAPEEFEDFTPFGDLRGKLAWPIEGRVVTPFGALRKGGRIRSQGVTLAAEAGKDVHAVSDGRVVFADWFRNLGLLLIIDHGAGYMSLYGHNEALLKQAGDLVSAGEIIGRAGDTGGIEDSGLYFEIRRNGAPQDPELWCRR